MRDVNGYGLHRMNRPAVINGAPEDRAAAIMTAAYYLGPVYGYVDLDPLLVLAQSAFETGNFTSRLIVEQRNAFGMRQPAQRPTTSTGAGPTGFATYETLADSVEDYFIRQAYFNVPDSMLAETYIQGTLASGYSSEAHYGAAWLNKYRELIQAGAPPVDQQGPGNSGGPLLGLLLIGGAVALSSTR